MLDKSTDLLKLQNSLSVSTNRTKNKMRETQTAETSILTTAELQNLRKKQFFSPRSVIAGFD